MPIFTKKDDYEETMLQVERVKDCLSQDEVKEKGELYLPKPSGQSITEYKAFLARGYLMPVVKPTVMALTGAIMRKEIITDMPTQLDYLLEDTDGNGKSLLLLATETINKMFLTGRVGYLIEPTLSNVNILSYSRESIINWSKDYIVLAQSYVTNDPKDKFNQITKDEYLELTFDENGLYIQNLWRENNKKWMIVETTQPSVRGQRLDYLPFVYTNTLDNTERLTTPALLQLADINLDQYRLSTDLRHGLHWAALPTFFIFGDIIDEQGKRVRLSVGAGSMNHIPDTDARAQLLEFTGAGLASIDKAIEKDVEMMASVAAKMLQPKQKGVKSAETAKIEQSSESATLITIAKSVEKGLTIALNMIAQWNGFKDNVSVTLNKDFADSSLDPQQLTALLQTWQSGGISLDSFLYQLEKGELLPPDISASDEADRIDTTGNNFAVM